MVESFANVNGIKIALIITIIIITIVVIFIVRYNHLFSFNYLKPLFYKYYPNNIIQKLYHNNIVSANNKRWGDRFEENDICW